MSEVEKDFCIDCGVEVFDGGTWGYCDPCGNRAFDKLIADKRKARNNVRPNHAVGEVYKPNIHDPHDMYRWEEPVSGWVWAGRVLGALGFFVGIYMLIVLAFLF